MAYAPSKFGICVCDSDDDHYDFPSEMGSLRAPIGGDSSLEDESWGPLRPTQEILTEAHFENEDPESRHTNRLAAMRMAIDEAVADAIEKSFSAQRANVTNGQRARRGYSRSPSPSFVAPSKNRSFATAPLPPPNGMLSPSTSMRVGGLRLGPAGPDASEAGGMVWGSSVARRSSMPDNQAPRPVPSFQATSPASAMRSTSGPSLASLAQSVFGSAVAVATAPVRACSPETTSRPVGRQSSYAAINGAAAERVSFSIAEGGPTSPRTSFKQTINPSSSSFSKSAEVSGGAFSPFWSGSAAQGPGSPRAGSPVTTRATEWQATSFSAGRPSPNGLTLGSPRAPSFTHGGTALGSLPEAGNLPSNPSDMPGKQFSPFYTSSSLGQAQHSSFGSNATPGSPKQGGYVRRQLSRGNVEAAAGQALVNPFWQPPDLSGGSNASATMPRSPRASAGAGFKAPAGLLSELLGVAGGPKPKQPARPKTVFWQPPLEATNVIGGA